MVSGDDSLCQEVGSRIPNCALASVKISLGLQNACSLTPAAAHKLIARKVEEGLTCCSQIAPFILPPPFTLNFSNRNPQKLELENSLEGDDIWLLMHAACNKVYAHFGNEDAVDDRSYRWPPNAN